MEYSNLVAGIVLLLWGAVVTNKGGLGSLLVVKVLPAALGIWCLWESAKAFVS